MEVVVSDKVLRLKHRSTPNAIGAAYPKLTILVFGQAFNPSTSKSAPFPFCAIYIEGLCASIVVVESATFGAHPKVPATVFHGSQYKIVAESLSRSLARPQQCKGVLPLVVIVQTPKFGADPDEA